MTTTAAMTPNSNQREPAGLPADALPFEPAPDFGICERFAINALSDSCVFWLLQGLPLLPPPELSRQYTTSKTNVN